MRISALVLLAAVISLGAGVVGCEKTFVHEMVLTRTTEQQVMGTCPVCGTQAPVGTYCDKCKAAVAEVKTFTCPDCGKEVKEGTWCAKHNKFRFADPAMKCPKTGKPVVKGAYCPKCKGYHGLPMVKYDPEKKQPYAVKK